MSASVPPVAPAPPLEGAYRLRTLQNIISDGVRLTAEALPELSEAACEWMCQGRILCVPWEGVERFTADQFAPVDGRPLPVLRQVLKAFGSAPDPWVLAT